MLIVWIGCVQGEKKIELRFKYGPDAELTYEQMSKRLVRVSEADSVVKENRSQYGATVVHITRDILDDTTIVVAEKVAWWFERRSKKDSTKIDTITQERELLMDMTNSGRVSNLRSVSGRPTLTLTISRRSMSRECRSSRRVNSPPGHSWTQTTSVVAPDETFEASTTYTIKSLARTSGYDCAVIEYTGVTLHSDRTKLRRHSIDHGARQSPERRCSLLRVSRGMRRSAERTLGDRWPATEKMDGKEPTDFQLDIEIDTEFELVSLK